MNKKIIIGLIVSGVVTFGAWKFLESSKLPVNSNGIRLYNAATDKAAVHKMFADDWYWMVSDDTIQNSNSQRYVNFMLDNKSSVQWEKRNNLTLKVAEDHGKVVGFSATYKKSPLAGHILFIVVDQDARKKGVAKALVTEALTSFFDQGFVKVSLDTRTGNQRARSLYSSLGFQLLEADDDYVHFVFYKDQPVPKVVIG